jgi:choline dehydrogenase-like flavoprotein
MKDNETLRVIVVGSGAGGATAARELQSLGCQVTIVEAGRKFEPLSLPMKWMELLRNWGLLFNERIISLVFPAMRVRKTKEGMSVVNGSAVGGTTLLSAGNALRIDGELKQLGIDLDREFNELTKDIPVSTAHEAFWSENTRRLFAICEKKGLSPIVAPKLVDYSLCRRCGRCVLGCPYGAKWDSRRFVDEAISLGTELLAGYRVTRILFESGRAIGVEARRGLRTVVLRADLVILAAGGLATPNILERSGIPTEKRLFVDPVLCVAAPWPSSNQHHEVPMPFVVQRKGYIVSPYFDYISFLFNKKWRRPAPNILGLMIKLADSEKGTVERNGRIEKTLTARDRERLAEAEALCRNILVDFGADPSSIVAGTLNAGHPGGMLPLTAKDSVTLHPERLTKNVYVADSSLFPASLGNPPILTIVALAQKIARTAFIAMRAENLLAEAKENIA